MQSAISFAFLALWSELINNHERHEWDELHERERSAISHQRSALRSLRLCVS